MSLKKDEIQCIVSEMELPLSNTIPFGKAQSPDLNDYADGVDVIDFLLKLPGEKEVLLNN